MPASLAGPWLGSSAFGVRHKEDAHTPVRGSDSRSFVHENPDGVTLSLQILTNVVRGKGEDSRYGLKNAPNRLNFTDQPRAFGPEIPFVRFRPAPAGARKGLARKSPVDDVDTTLFIFFAIANRLHNSLAGQFAHIVENGDAGPAFSQYRPAKFILFAHRGNLSARALERDVQSSDSRKQRQSRHRAASPRSAS
jgi:hypothetical protein